MDSRESLSGLLVLDRIARGIGAGMTYLHSGWDTNLRLKVLGETALRYLTSIIRIRFRVRMPRTKE